LEETLKTLPSGRRQKREILEEETKRKSEGRGSPTRGWRAIAPQKHTERHELYDKCGDKCFLDPEKEGYPICPSLRASRGKCGVDCRGIEAAKVRARQYKREDIAEEAQKLQDKYRCQERFKPKSSRTLSPKRKLAERGERGNREEEEIPRRTFGQKDLSPRGRNQLILNTVKSNLENNPVYKALSSRKFD
jgi:hypothetical protein